MSKKPVYTNILQIAVVVKDCDATVKKYADDYGIGPWSIYEFNPNTVSDMIIEGKPVEYAMRLALEHPLTGKALEWEAPAPPDMAALIGALKADADEQRRG